MSCHVFEVHQGPDFLVNMLYCPPWWLVPAVIAVALIVGSLAYLGYRRHGIDDQVEYEMLRNLLIVVIIGAIVLVLRSGPLPYFADVAIAVLVGWPLAIAATNKIYDTVNA